MATITIIIVIVFLVLSIKQINEYERGVLFSFGKFSKVLTPGWKIVIPFIQSYSKVDVRTLATLNDLSGDQSNTVIFAIPVEILSAFQSIADFAKKATNKLLF